MNSTDQMILWGLVFFSLTAAFFAVRAFFFRKKEVGAPVVWTDDLSRPPGEEDVRQAFLEAEERAARAHELTKCVRCDLKATHFAPMISGAPLDSWPIVGRMVGFFWDLFSLPWLYGVRANESGGLCYCDSHAQEEYDGCRNECAQLRAAHAKFNNDQQLRVATKNRSLVRREQRSVSR